MRLEYPLLCEWGFGRMRAALGLADSVLIFEKAHCVVGLHQTSALIAGWMECIE